MSVKQGRVFVMSLLATVLWSAPALAYTCEEEFNDCITYAWQERDDRVREYLEAECHARYSECTSQPAVCGDYYCGGEESCANCPQDCGTGNGTSDLGTVKRNCTSTVLSTHINYLGAYMMGGWCYYPVYQYVSTTCSVYRRTQIYTCGNAPYVQETYEGNSTEYAQVYAGTYPQYGQCRYY
jgi:hypothetical protein